MCQSYTAFETKNIYGDIKVHLNDAWYIQIYV